MSAKGWRVVNFPSAIDFESFSFFKIQKYDGQNIAIFKKKILPDDMID